MGLVGEISETKAPKRSLEPAGAADIARIRALPWPAALATHNARLSLEDSYRAGQLISEEVYGAGRSPRGRQGSWSLRLLHERVLDRASFATLARCVQVYESCKRLGLKPPLEGVRAGHLLNITHLSHAAQRHLVARLSEERMSVKALRERAGRGAARLRTPGLLKTLNALGGRVLEGELEVLGQVDQAQAEELKEQLTRAREMLVRLEAALVP